MRLRPVQTRTGSLFEAALNVAIGYLVAFATQMAVYPLFGLAVPIPDQAAIAGIFTLVSLARSYLLRRLFERMGRTAPAMS